MSCSRKCKECGKRMCKCTCPKEARVSRPASETVTIVRAEKPKTAFEKLLQQQEELNV